MENLSVINNLTRHIAVINNNNHTLFEIKIPKNFFNCCMLM